MAHSSHKSFLFLAALVLSLPAFSETLTFTPDDRVLVLAPHPDDEMLGAGGLIQEAQARGADVRVLFLTSGDRAVQTAPKWAQTLARWAARVGIETRVHNPGLHKGKVRMKEAVTAAGLLSVPASRLIFLGYPDSFTLHLWLNIWDGPRSFKSKYTQADAVPYARTRRRGTPYRPEEMVQDLREVMEEFKPTVIAVSHPSDTNSDHRALYLATRVALWSSALEKSPRLLPYLVHHPNWPVLENPREWPDDLARLPSTEVPLSDERQAKKRRAMLAHESQNISSDPALMSLVDGAESFCDFPSIVLSPGRTVPLGDSMVGIEGGSVSWHENALALTLRSRFEFKPDTLLVVSLQGFRRDVAFIKMPKIRVTADGTGIWAEERGLPMTEGARTDVTPAGFAIEVDWASLGEPDRVLLAIQTFENDRLSAVLGVRVIERGPR